jgi:hypothetical protein
MYNRNGKTALALVVTCRLNVYTREGWTHPTLDGYLDFIEKHDKLRRITEDIQSQFVHKDGVFTDGGEPQGDAVIYPQFLDDPLKQHYRLRKLELVVVNYFGVFQPLGAGLVLQGVGNGLVVLDVDLKELGSEIPKP